MLWHKIMVQTPRIFNTGATHVAVRDEFCRFSAGGGDKNAHITIMENI